MFETLERELQVRLRTCVSGMELLGMGFPQDVEAASALDVDSIVPVLRDGAYSALEAL